MSSNTASLYVCATPIGHLGDVSSRLIETLSSVDVIACEDTRVTKQLLGHLKLSKPTFSLHAHNEVSRISTILSYLEEGKSVALVSDAGTPTVSDPGNIVVEAVRKSGFKIVPISGPSAVSTLLSVAGLSADRYYFHGFLPRKAQELAALAPVWEPLNCPIVFFESAKRLEASISRLKDTFDITRLVLGKELTKRFETVISGSVDEIESQLKDIPIKGEWVGAICLAEDAEDGKQQDALITLFKEAGLSQKQAVQLGRGMGLSRNTIYEAWLT